MEERVCLTSDYARQFTTKASVRTANKGFWSNLLERFNESRGEITLQPTSLAAPNPGSLEGLGYQPFCKIGEVRVHIREFGNLREVAILEDGQPWDLSEWGAGPTFKSRLVAEMYFMVTRDDFQIDEQEATVLMALFNCIRPSPEQIAEAKEMVYWTLVENTMEDGVITDEEQEVMGMIRVALELTPTEVATLHCKAVEERLREIIMRPDGEPAPTLTEVDQALQMADRLQVDLHLLKDLAFQARARAVGDQGT
jgi:hypothetical protein